VSFHAAAEAPRLGEVGKWGRLVLRLARREGRTVVADQFWTLPLQVMPPSYQDDDDQAYVYLLNPTGGIVQGDRLETEVVLEAGARGLLTTQSATKVYRMDAGQAEERAHLVLRGDAALEYLPDPTIPFAGARLARSTVVDLDPDSTLILTEIVAAGRVARGERFAFDRLAIDVEVRVAGEAALVDRLRLAPRDGSPARPGIWDGYDYYGTLYACSPRLDAGLAARLAALMEAGAEVYAGAGQPAPGVAIARVLGPGSEAVRGLLFDAWDLLRRPLLGKPARPLRKF